VSCRSRNSTRFDPWLTSGRNITIATFSDFAFYKKEAYDANLYAGKILAEHGVPVAYKSVSISSSHFLINVDLFARTTSPKL
jgi:hypothetical protein